jgi:hypothetical protein
MLQYYMIWDDVIRECMLLGCRLSRNSSPRLQLHRTETEGELIPRATDLLQIDVVSIFPISVVLAILQFAQSFIQLLLLTPTACLFSTDASFLLLITPFTRLPSFLYFLYPIP